MNFYRSGKVRGPEFLVEAFRGDEALIRRAAGGLELVVLDLFLEEITDDENKQAELKLAGADAPRLPRVLPKYGRVRENRRIPPPPSFFRRLNGRMSFHTSSMWARHSALVPVNPSFLQPRAFSRSSGQTNQRFP